MMIFSEIQPFVTTVNQSKQLLTLGLGYDTKFVWYIQTEHDNASIRCRNQISKRGGNIEIYPAYTSEELYDIIINKLGYDNKIYLLLKGNSKLSLTELLYNTITKKTTESGINI